MKQIISKTQIENVRKKTDKFITRKLVLPGALDGSGLTYSSFVLESSAHREQTILTDVTVSFITVTSKSNSRKIARFRKMLQCPSRVSDILA